MKNGQDKKKELFVWVVALCRLLRRPVTIEDILQQIETSQKPVRYLLMALEEDGMVIKTSVRIGGIGRKRFAWLPVGREAYSGTSDSSSMVGKGTCEVCEKAPAIIHVGGHTLCRRCMRGFEDKDGGWIVVGQDEETERTFSRLSMNRND